MLTKEQLVNIGADKLADIFLSLYQNRPEFKKPLEIVFAGFDSDPKKIVAMIKKDITSLKNSSRFVDLRDSSTLCDKINQIRIHIMEDLLPKSPKQAVELLLSLLDIHEKTLERTDDSGGRVGGAFIKVCADLGKAYKYTTYSLSVVVNLVYDRFTTDGYNICNNIIEDFKDVLGDEGLNLLKQKLERSPSQLKKCITNPVKHGLEKIADCLNDVDMYIAACSVTGEPHSTDHLKIAKRLIAHERGEEAINWLDSTEMLSYIQAEKMALKVQALDLCGKHEEAKAERQKLFETTLSPEVYREILENSEADLIQSFKELAIQKAFDFADAYVALDFLKDIQEFEQASKLICKRIDIIDGSNYYKLRPIAEMLSETYPLAATLLYRKMAESILIKAKSRYYHFPAKDLAVCHSLSSKVTDWQGFKNHQLYFEELSKQHKQKSSFWPEYTEALNEKMAQDAKANGNVKRKSTNKKGSNPPKKLKK